MKIIFVRHGEINLKTGTLTRTGVKQIQMSSKYLMNEQIEAIFCSPQTRTIQSAKILNTYFKKDVIIEKGLDERQVLNPLQRDKFGEEFDEHYFDYNFESTNYETCKEFIDRVFNAILNIMNNVDPNIFKKVKDPIEFMKKGVLNQRGVLSFPDITIAIVAHSSTLYGINAFLNGIPSDGEVNWLQCNNGAVVKYFV